MRYSPVVIAIIGAIVFCGCGEIGEKENVGLSAQVKTEDIILQADFSTKGDGYASATIKLYTSKYINGWFGGGYYETSYLKLSSEDVLSVIVDQVEYPVEAKEENCFVYENEVEKDVCPDGVFERVFYLSNQLPATPGSNYQISLNRQGERATYEFTVQMLQPLFIQLPLANQLFSMNEEIALVWDQLIEENNPSVQLEQQIRCPATVSGPNNGQFEINLTATSSVSIADTGRYYEGYSVFNRVKSSIRDWNSYDSCNFKQEICQQLAKGSEITLNEGGYCELELELKRRKIGTVSSEFKVGTKIESSQTRKVKVYISLIPEAVAD